LGIKDLRKFNYALLEKWRWNLFHNQRELWARVLVLKYGEWRNWDEVRRGNTKSSWWKDIRSIAHSTEEGSWFVKGIKWNLGCRARVQFWEDDGVPLMLKYPRLYSISPINNNNPFNRWEVSQVQGGSRISNGGSHFLMLRLIWQPSSWKKWMVSSSIQIV